jgi:hypothetical protein
MGNYAIVYVSAVIVILVLKICYLVNLCKFVKCVMSGAARLSIAIKNTPLSITTVNAEFFYSMPSFVYAEHRNLAPYVE